MSIERHPDGRRSVRVEAEFRGTPEQVWQAIASGPGVSAWFVPTTIDGRVGGTVTSDFGGGMMSTANITAWQPPLRFTAEAAGWAPDMPTVATEWTVTAKAGGTCIVRVVHSMFASTDDWNGQLEGTESGWPSYFRVLRRYLESFAGQPCAQIQAMAMSQAPGDQVWANLAQALSLRAPRPGQRFRAEVAAGFAIAGEIETVDAQGKGSSIFARLTEPAPGSMFAGAFDCGGTMASLQLYLYGASAAGRAAAARPQVQSWLEGLLPAAAAD